MGQVTDYLATLIRNRVKEKGIVVWYDPERHFEKGLSGFDFGNTPVIRYEGSYFRIRLLLESCLGDAVPRKCIVYVSAERKKGASPLIEAEAAGQIVEPGAVTGNNTRLEVIARAALSEVLTAENVEEICKSVAKGSLSLEELDVIAEQGKEPGKGVIPLIFGTGNTQEIALKFLSSEEFDSTLVEKSGLPELSMLFKAAYGFDAAGSDPVAIRQSLGRYILLSEFLLCIRNEAIRQGFEQTPKAQKAAYGEACRQLADVWRNRLDLREAYEKRATEIEQTFGVATLKVSPEDVANCETFPCTEGWLRRFACEWILENEPARARDLISARKTSFWSVMEPLGLLRWNLLETAATLIEKAGDIKKILNQKSLTAQELVEQYVNGSAESSGWYVLDYSHRLLEKQYAHYDEGTSDREDDLFHRTVTKARASYMETTGLLAECFLDQLAKEKKPWSTLPRQQQLFQNHVKEKAGQGKTAYILVDALRFEMGKELFDAIQEFPERRLAFAVAAAPTVTLVGMAALLPGAEDGLTISEAAEGLIPKIGDAILKDRKSRMDWLKAKMDRKTIDLKLEDVIKPRKKTKEEIEGAEFIVVTSQEIDEICEGDNIHLARKVMNDVLDELVRGVRNLSRLGVKNFIITSDHGYLFGEELPDAMKIDPPGGKTLALHRRFWAGQGGKDETSFLRISSEKLGVGTAFDLAFPRGLGGFKVKGGARAYFHGGLSLQELIIPIISATAADKRIITEEENTYDLSLDRQKVTARFFTLRIKYGWAGFFGKEKQRVRIVVKAGTHEVGSVATAVYGHEAGTSEIILKKDKENHVTIMLQEGIKEQTITVMMIDSDTGKELKKIGAIPLALTF